MSEELKPCPSILIDGGFRVIIDTDDVELLSNYRWGLNSRTENRRYAVTWVDGKKTYMHRMILGAAPGQRIDHINGNELDNRRGNLRVCNASQNGANRRNWRREKSSQFKGVHWQVGIEKWRARLCIGGKRIHLGLYDNELDAARAYDVAAKRTWGDFAKVNGV